MWAASARTATYPGGVACWDNGGYGHAALVTDVEHDQKFRSNGRYIDNFRGWFDPTNPIWGTVTCRSTQIKVFITSRKGARTDYLKGVRLPHSPAQLIRLSLELKKAKKRYQSTTRVLQLFLSNIKGWTFLPSLLIMSKMSHPVKIMVAAFISRFD